MGSLFGSMFLAKTDVEQLVSDSVDEMKHSRIATTRRRNSYVVNNRMSKTIGVVDAPFAHMRGAVSDNTCCET